MPLRGAEAFISIAVGHGQLLSHVAFRQNVDRALLLTQLLQYFLEWLALPSVGLSALFIVSLLAATILPLGSEPVFLGYLTLKPEMFWVALAVVTVGNSLGGFVTYWMGAGAAGAYRRWRRPAPLVREGALRPLARAQVESPPQAGVPSRAERWVRRFGAPVLLLSWLPLVGDPLCAVAGWLRLPWLSCLVYMVIGKFLRYLVLGWALQQLVKPL